MQELFKLLHKGCKIYMLNPVLEIVDKSCQTFSYKLKICVLQLGFSAHVHVVPECYFKPCKCE